jgi:hypothetical protein
MNKEQLLRHIMAIIYRNGHWSNHAEKFDEILLLVHSEMDNIEETADITLNQNIFWQESADEYNERNRIS